jgi:hypothetical protein
MRVAEPVRKKLEDLYSATRWKIWVYVKDGQPEQFLALPPETGPPQWHRVFKDHQLAGVLDLTTGQYGREANLESRVQTLSWKLVVLALLARVVQLIGVIVAIALVVFTMILGMAGASRGSRRW